MNNKERQKFDELILEIGSLIDLINPSARAEQSFQKKLSDITLDDMKGQVGFLRIFVGYVLLDVEACRRENSSLLEIIDHPGGQGEIS